MSWGAASEPWFAFLVHPRDVADCYEMPGASLIRKYSDSEEEFVRKVCTNPPMVGGAVVFAGQPIRGEVIGAMRMPDAIATPDGVKQVVAAARVAQQRGARVVGLGALTAPITWGGRLLLKQLPDPPIVTNGNGLTAAIARQNVHAAADWLGLGTDARVAVLGAPGSVGSPCCHLLAGDGFRLTLIGRRLETVHEVLGAVIEAGARPSVEMADLAEADVVVVLTNDPAAHVTPLHVKPGAVVIDVSQPHNVEAHELPAFEAHGAHVVRGGLVRIPGYASEHDFRLPTPADTFACLAETYLIAREGLREHSVGRATPEHALRMERAAARHGAVASPLALPERGKIDTEAGPREGELIAGGAVATQMGRVP